MPRIANTAARIVPSSLTVKAMEFNGTNQAVTFGNILSTETVVTATAWMYVQATPSGNFEIILGYNNNRWFFIHPGADRDFRFTFNVAGVEKAVTTTFNPAVQTWYFVTGRYDPDGGADNHRIRVYNADGSLAQSVTATQTGAMDSTASQLRAAHDDGRGYFWDGRLDDIRVYNRFLSDEELDLLAIHTEPDPTGLKLHCEFDTENGSQAICKVGTKSGFVGTLVNSPTYVTGIVPKHRSTSGTRVAVF